MKQSATESSRKRRIALIDVDGILFAEACSSEKATKVSQGAEEVTYFPTQTPEEAFEKVVKRIEELVFKVEADSAILCMSWAGGNWRYGVLPSYKSNRHGQRRPPMLKVLQDMLQEEKPFPVMLVKDLEADDVCGIAAGSLTNEERETVICSPDKDLRSIPGLLYACRSDSRVETITEAGANYFHLFQALVGDPVDGYAGCPKVGKVKAAALLEPFCNCEDGFDVAGAWAAVVAAFEKVGLTTEDALTQARVSRILRATDWDNEEKRVILWEPPMPAKTSAIAA
jgi:DNA polymerase-1